MEKIPNKRSYGQKGVTVCLDMQSVMIIDESLSPSSEDYLIDVNYPIETYL